MFTTCVKITILVILVSLGINLVGSFNAFPTEDITGLEITSTDSALTQLTGLTGGMENIWLLVTSLGAVGSVALAWALHSPAPIGIFLFGEVFWTSWIRASGILSLGGHMPPEFLLMITVGMMFLFIGAIISMLTGKG